MPHTILHHSKSLSVASKTNNSLNLPAPLTILHTSDWHLGRRLYGQMRYAEFDAFFKWLTNTIVQKQVDVLMVAGDIFDTMTPSNRAQSLYYEFLYTVSKLCCQHVVIVSGNHDSPTFLDAPANILQCLSIHVIGTACDNVEDEVLTLKDSKGMPQCIITAVPYLRDKDVRMSNAGESYDKKDAKVIAGIQRHYDQVAGFAKSRQAEIQQNTGISIPIIATGHLFAAGGKTTGDDGVRELYVGSLGKISADTFDSCFDYVALGHLHVPQRVGGREHIRYSGSPIPMGFGEARQQKQVLLVQFGVSRPEPIEKSTKNQLLNNPDLFMDDLFDFDRDHDQKNTQNNLDINTPKNSVDNVLHHNPENHMQISSIHIPCFQKLMQVTGDLEHIKSTIKLLPQTQPIWLEVTYNGDKVVSDLRVQVQELIKHTQLVVLKIKNNQNYDKVLNAQNSTEALQDLTEVEVFERCLTISGIAESQKAELRAAYLQILHDLIHDDKMAE